MDIEIKTAQIRKRIEKLNWDLNSGTTYSQKKREQKEQEITDLKKELADLEQKLTN